MICSSLVLNLVAVYLWPRQVSTNMTAPGALGVVSASTSFDFHNMRKVQYQSPPLQRLPAWARPPFHVGCWGSNTKIFENTMAVACHAFLCLRYCWYAVGAAAARKPCKRRTLARTLHAIYSQADKDRFSSTIFRQVTEVLASDLEVHASWR